MGDGEGDGDGIEMTTSTSNGGDSGRIIPIMSMENMSRPVSGSSASSVGGGVVRFLNPMSTSFVDRHRSKRTYSTATEIIIARLFDAKDKIQVKRNLVFTRCDSTRSVMVGNMFNPHHKIYQTCMFTLETLGIIHALYTSYDMSFVTNRERLWLLVIDCILDAAFMFESYIQTHPPLLLLLPGPLRLVLHHHQHVSPPPRARKRHVPLAQQHKEQELWRGSERPHRWARPHPRSMPRGRL